jgi:hypothetical protein
VLVEASDSAPARKPAPAFATGTTPGSRSPVEPPKPATTAPAAARATKPTTPDKPTAKRGKPEFAAGTVPGQGGPEQVGSGQDRGPDQSGRDIAAAQTAARAAMAAPIPEKPSAESTPRSGPVSMEPSGPVPKAATVASGSGPNDGDAKTPLSATPDDPLRAWNSVLSELETRRKFSLLGPFQHARVMKWNADEIDLGFPIDVHSMGEMAGDKQNVDELRAIIRELGAGALDRVKLVVRLLDATESGQNAARSVLETSRERSTLERQKREAEAREHPITKHVLQTFGAQIKEIKTDV